jgi:hypothetical protein
LTRSISGPGKIFSPLLGTSLRPLSGARRGGKGFPIPGKQKRHSAGGAGASAPRGWRAGIISDHDDELAALQAESQTHGDAPLAFAIFGDRIRLRADSLLGAGTPEIDRSPELANLERLASQYNAARLEQESAVQDVSVYGKIAAVRAMTGDDGGAAVAYERALSAVRRVFVALAPFPEVQSRFVARQNPLIAAARECCLRLGRSADAERCARLLT